MGQDLFFVEKNIRREDKNYNIKLFFVILISILAIVAFGLGLESYLVLNPADGEINFGDRNVVTDGNMFVRGGEVRVGTDTLILRSEGDQNTITTGDGQQGIDLPEELSFKNMILDGVSVTATGTELNLLDGSLPGIVTNNKAVIYNSTGGVKVQYLEYLNNNIAIGNGAGELNQGTDAIAIGQMAGQTTQGNRSITVGATAGQTNQGIDSIGIGYAAGMANQKNGSIALGAAAGQTNQGIEAIAIGVCSGILGQSYGAVALGAKAGNLNQQNLAVALGHQAGSTRQGQNSIALGERAGLTNQGNRSIAIGSLAGVNYQAQNSIVINATGGILENTSPGSFIVKPIRGREGVCSLQYDPDTGEISYSSFGTDHDVTWNTLRDKTGSNGPGEIALGYFSGNTNQGTNTVALGSNAGNQDQENNSVAIGNNSGKTTQGESSVAVGNGAGGTTQGTFSVAVGVAAGGTSQGTFSVAIGNAPAAASQGDSSVAIGSGAGHTNQGDSSIAIGDSPAFFNQGRKSIAIGPGAGRNNQGNNSIAIGNEAGLNNQADRSIIINGTSIPLNNTTPDSCKINPIRLDDSPTVLLGYDNTTKEITRTSEARYITAVEIKQLFTNVRRMNKSKIDITSGQTSGSTVIFHLENTILTNMIWVVHSQITCSTGVIATTLQDGSGTDIFDSTGQTLGQGRLPFNDSKISIPAGSQTRLSAGNIAMLQADAIPHSTPPFSLDNSGTNIATYFDTLQNLVLRRKITTDYPSYTAVNKGLTSTVLVVGSGGTFTVSATEAITVILEYIEV